MKYLNKLKGEITINGNYYGLVAMKSRDIWYIGYERTVRIEDPIFLAENKDLEKAAKELYEKLNIICI